MLPAAPSVLYRPQGPTRHRQAARACGARRPRAARAAAPETLWVTDITEHPTDQDKLFCCAIKDLFSNRIVGSAIDGRMTAQLAVTALRTPVARRQTLGFVVVHNDRLSPGSSVNGPSGRS